MYPRAVPLAFEIVQEVDGYVGSSDDAVLVHSSMPVAMETPTSALYVVSLM
jgi:hypothetical protein